MGDTSRVPSAADLDRLTQAFQRDPSSAAFVNLGQAFIALGRPRDAVEVGAAGLKASPENIEGRIMVATAFALMHQWKEAQAELLKVVKKDRNNARGFRLLGEVLMRRSDYDRALPVLQHAQNLSPADPSILGLLRRARAGQPLDPPPPIPTPVKPRNGHRQPQAVRADSLDELDAMPTRVAGDLYNQSAQSNDTYNAAEAQALGRVGLDRREVPGRGPSAPTERDRRRGPDARGDDAPAPPRPVQHHGLPPREDPFAPIGAPPVAAAPVADLGRGPQMPPPQRGGPPRPPPGGGRQKRPSAGPPPNVRPRVMQQKPKGAAQSALRQSAAVGEQYLNNLLTAGLLDVPNVQARDMEFDIGADKAWGRSSKRMFIYLFILMFVGLGGAGGWYWYSEQQKQEDIARLLEKAKKNVEDGDFDQLKLGNEAALGAMKLDKTNVYAVAVYAENTGITSLLYGAIDPEEVERAVEVVGKEIKEKTQQGYRERLVGFATASLAKLHDMGDQASDRLKDVRAQLKDYLESSPDDHLVRWLLGRALLAGGSRDAAKTAFEQAYNRGDGPIVAGVDLADMHLDAGDFESAMKLYEAALDKSPNHQLAYLGRAFARVERSADPREAIEDLNVGLAEPKGQRIKGYKYLGLAQVNHQIEDYEKFKSDLTMAAQSRVMDARFLVRVSLLRVAQGKLALAGKSRTQIKWHYGEKKPDKAHPLQAILDAELMLQFAGQPKAALDQIGKRKGLRASKLRGRAYVELGQLKEATIEFDDALEIAPDDVDTQMWAAATRVLSGTGDGRRKANEELDRLGLAAKSKSVKVVHGIVLLKTGNVRDARYKLDQSLEEITDEYPNPFEYRARIALAEIDWREGKLDKAAENLDKALKIAPGYLPAHDVTCRLLSSTTQPQQARDSCFKVVDSGNASWGAELGLVKSYAPITNKEDIETATNAVRRAKAKGAPEASLAPVIALLNNPALFEELDVDPEKE